MGVYIKGSPSEGIYRLTYQDTSDKGMVAVLEGEDIAFIGQIVKAPHGRLVDIDKTMRIVASGVRLEVGELSELTTVIEAEVE